MGTGVSLPAMAAAAAQLGRDSRDSCVHVTAIMHDSISAAARRGRHAGPLRGRLALGPRLRRGRSSPTAAPSRPTFSIRRSSQSEKRT